LPKGETDTAFRKRIGSYILARRGAVKATSGVNHSPDLYRREK
jgi:hypothetical protein